MVPLAIGESEEALLQERVALVPQRQCKAQLLVVIAQSPESVLTPDGKRLLEVSIKAPTVQAAAALAGFMAFLAELGAERDLNQQTKTRAAMEFFMPEVRQQAPKRKAPRRARASCRDSSSARAR